MKRTPAIVRAVWADAHSIDAWTELSALAKNAELLIVESVGFLVLDTKSVIGVAASYNGDASSESGAASSIIIIPRRMLLDKLVVLVPATTEPQEVRP